MCNDFLIFHLLLLILILLFSKVGVRGMITIGSDRYFSTGMDVDWLRRSSPSVLDLYHDDLHRLYTRILTLGVTSVAVVNGNLATCSNIVSIVYLLLLYM